MGELALRKWPCFVVLASDVKVWFTPPQYAFHAHSLAGREVANAPGSPKIECMSFMETLCHSGAFGGSLHVCKLCFVS